MKILLVFIIMLNKNEIAKIIDHTLLKPNTTKNQIKRLCDEAILYGFYSICINPYFVTFCKKQLKNTPIKICTVIGFPLGATTTQTKVFETKNAIKEGSDEIDMVINVGLLKSKDYINTEKDIKAVVQAAQGKIVKVIIETCLLTDIEKIKACKLIKKSGAQYIKTSTGFSHKGADIKDVLLFRRILGKDFKIKASGGIKTLNQVKKFVKAGVNRIGASNSVNIIKEIK